MDSTDIPCAMVLTVNFVIPGESGLLVTVIPKKLASRELDAGVEASGPHDFAVRFGVVRLSTLSRPPHPAPNVRDDGETPLLWARDADDSADDLGARSIAANCGRLARRANHYCRRTRVTRWLSSRIERRQWVSSNMAEQTCRASGKSDVYCYHGKLEDTVRCIAEAPKPPRPQPIRQG